MGKAEIKSQVMLGLGVAVGSILFARFLREPIVGMLNKTSATAQVQGV